MNLFPSKNHLAFLTMERYDIELTNIKISDKNIVPPGGAQAPEGRSFLLLFWNFADFGMKCWVSKKNFKFQILLFMVTSQEHCTNQVTITLMTTLLPDQVTFIFHSREIVIHCFIQETKSIYFHFHKRVFISTLCF